MSKYPVHQMLLVFLMLSILVISGFMFFPLLAASEAPHKEWERTYGPIVGYSVVQTADGGYAIAGNGGIWSQARGPGSWTNLTFLLIKTNAAGDLQWEKTYGTGDENDSRAFSLVQTSDGGFAIAGIKQTFSGIVNETYTVTTGLWFVKTNGEGNMQWNRTLPWSWVYGPNVVVVQTNDGGYALAGSGGNTTRVPFLIKIDNDGNVLWNVTFGGTYSDYIASLVETSDGGFAMAGDTGSFGAAGGDGWLVRTDSEGNVAWSKAYGIEGGETFNSLVETHDCGYLLAGVRNVPNVGQYGWAVKTDSQGSKQWEMTYDVDSSRFFSVALSKDGGYVLAGDVGISKALLVKIDAEGAVEWSITHGESDDHFYSMVATSDGGYAVTGLKHGKNDCDNEVWLAKFAPEPINQQTEPPPSEPFTTWLIVATATIALAGAAMTVGILILIYRRKSASTKNQL